jgi:endogenous inhibitor of DNA gyrase (YacG/DUF329 family)
VLHAVKRRCPSCGRLFQPKADDPFLPFCSERCKLIDLGDWLNEQHRIPSDEAPDDLSDIPDSDDKTH